MGSLLLQLTDTPVVNEIRSQVRVALLSDEGAPDDSTGFDGDFYLDQTAHSLYGPKANGVWGEGVDLVGPTGDAGADAPIVVIHYSVDATSWHATFADGDNYMRFSVDNGATWSQAVAVMFYPDAANVIEGGTF